MAATKMMRKGQVTIPVAIREKLNLKEGDFLVVNEVDGKVVLESQRNIVRRTAGVFAEYATKSSATRTRSDSRTRRAAHCQGSSAIHARRGGTIN